MTEKNCKCNLFSLGDFIVKDDEPGAGNEFFVSSSAVQNVLTLFNNKQYVNLIFWFSCYVTFLKIYTSFCQKYQQNVLSNILQYAESCLALEERAGSCRFGQNPEPEQPKKALLCNTDCELYRIRTLLV